MLSLLIKRLFLLFYICLTAFSSGATTPEQETAYVHAQSIFRSSQFTLVSTNTLGDHISYIERLDVGQRLMLLNLKTNKLQVLIEDELNTIVNYHWVDDDTLVLARKHQNFSQSLWQVNINYIDDNLENIYERRLVDDAYVIDTLPHRHDRVMIKNYSAEKSYIYVLNLNARNIGGQLRNKYKLNRLAPDADSWLSDKKGDLRIGYRSNKNGKNEAWYKAKGKKKWQLIWSDKQDTNFIPVLLRSDSEKLYVLSNHNRNFTELLVFDLQSKQFTNSILKIDGYDVETVELNKSSTDILYASYTENGNYRRHYFTELDSYLGETLNRKVKTENIWVVDSSLNNETIIALKRNSQNPGTFYLFDTKSWKLSELMMTQPWLDAFTLGSEQSIQSTSSDGLKIESYLTLPANYKDVTPPLIVMPHGGPISVRSYLDYDPHVQYLATLGYAVLRPNYRGSSGYGQAFKLAAKRQWGKLIEDDIESAVSEVIKSGLINSEKICIYGSSYGGYSALMGAIRSPDIFKCAASYVGVTDISLMYTNDAHAFGQHVLDWRKDYVGDPHSQQQELMRQSPVYQAKSLNVPVFLAQGGRDQIVDKEHFYRMKWALKDKKSIVETLMIPEEGHGFGLLSSYYLLYAKLDHFFRVALDLPPPKVLQAQ